MMLRMLGMNVSNCFDSFMTLANLESVNISIFQYFFMLELDSKHALHFPLSDSIKQIKSTDVNTKIYKPRQNR